jgi:ABC-type lipoprotein release transport system permease subunit
LGTEAVRGSITPTLVEGRAPRGPSELLLGTRTLEDLGLKIGDGVDVRYGGRTVRMRIVGRGVLSEFAGAARLGEGAELTLAGVRRLVPDAVQNILLLRLRPGADTTTLLRDLHRAAGDSVYLPKKPSDLTDLQRVGGVPFVVAGLLGLMAVATLAHTLVTSVRRRRRDLAVLKTLGFVRGQVSTAVAWQSSALALVAVAGGLPLGIVAGRWGWRVFADRLGVPPRPVTPVAAVALLVPATLLLANLIAAVPGRLAARTRPATVLRSE